MKRHLILTILGSLALSAFVAQAQDAAAPAAEPTETPAEVVAEPAVEAQPEIVAEPAVEAVAADTGEAEPAMEGAAVTAEEAPAMDATTEVAPVEGEEAPEATAEEAAAVDAETPAAEESILIVIDDTPLLDAIQNLARQANINLIIDPKVGYGQTDGSGRPVAQPNVSIRWEGITAEQALDALLENYGLQREDNPKAQITRITVKDPAAPDPLVTQTIQLQYAAPSNVVAAVTATFIDKRSKVVADTRTSQLVVVTTEKELVEIEKLVKELDTPTKQVLIESRIYETSVNPTTVKGINWQQTLGNGTGEGLQMAFGNTPLNNISLNDAGSADPAAAISPAGGNFTFNPATAFLDSSGLRATLSFLNTSSDSKILASPRTVTLDNETAQIEAGTLYPIINVTAGTANSTGGSQVNYSNLTIRLDVTPRISANNQINLKVQPHVMRLEKVETFTLGAVENGDPSTFQVPVFATRHLDTRVMIPSGNTLVMGGLISDSITEGNIKVPVLGDIPFLGRLFRQDTKERNQGNLIVFVTPTIVQDQDFQPTETDYLKTPLPGDTVDKDWTWWDSGKPANSDWSK